MKNYIACEYLKIKKWYFVYLVMLIPILSVVMAYIVSSKVYEAGSVNVTLGELIYSFATSIFFVIGLPILVVVFLVMYVHIEFANGGWKLLKISGGNIHKVIVAKLIVSYLFLGISYISYYFVILLGGRIWHFSFEYDTLARLLCFSLFGTILNCTFWFLVFHFCKMIVVNALIGIVGVVVNSIVLQTKYWKYIFTTYYYCVIIVGDEMQSTILLECILLNILLVAVTISLAYCYGKNTKNE